MATFAYFYFSALFKSSIKNLYYFSNQKTCTHTYIQKMLLSLKITISDGRVMEKHVLVGSRMNDAITK